MTEEKKAPGICIREEQGKDVPGVQELLRGSFEGNIEAEIIHHIWKDCGRCLSS